MYFFHLLLLNRRNMNIYMYQCTLYSKIDSFLNIDILNT